MGIRFLSSAVMTVLATPLVGAAGTVLTACRASVGLMEVEATLGSLSPGCQLCLLILDCARARLQVHNPKSWGAYGDDRYQPTNVLARRGTECVLTSFLAMDAFWV